MIDQWTSKFDLLSKTLEETKDELKTANELLVKEKHNSSEKEATITINNEQLHKQENSINLLTERIRILQIEVNNNNNVIIELKNNNNNLTNTILQKDEIINHLGNENKKHVAAIKVLENEMEGVVSEESLFYDTENEININIYIYI